MALFSLYAVKKVNTEKGMHFFDRETMRFFRGRVMGDVFPTAQGAVFVTSERENDETPRLYTTRYIDENTGGVETLGAFQEFKSRSGALGAAKRRAANISAFIGQD